MNNNINVDISALETHAKTISDQLSIVEEALTEAETAGQNALNALGGTSTPTGSAVSSKIVDINIEEFKKTRVSFDNFYHSLQNAGKVYKEAEEDFVSKINSFGGDEQ